MKIKIKLVSTDRKTKKTTQESMVAERQPPEIFVKEKGQKRVFIKLFYIYLNVHEVKLLPGA